MVSKTRRNSNMKKLIKLQLFQVLIKAHPGETAFADIMKTFFEEGKRLSEIREDELFIDDYIGIYNSARKRIDWQDRPLDEEYLEKEMQFSYLISAAHFPVSTSQLLREYEVAQIDSNNEKKKAYLRYHTIKYISDVIIIYQIFKRDTRQELGISLDADRTWQQKEENYQ